MVGIFTDPVSYTGDYLAKNVLRGMLGVFQPLLDWDRNHALSEAGAVRAVIARDALAGELNHQQAEAALAFVGIQALRRRLEVDRARLAWAQRSLALADHLRGAGRAGDADRLEAQHALIAGRTELEGDQRWLTVLLDRLKGCCGLASGCTSEPVDAPAFQPAPLPGYADLLRTALLNHPQLQAAQAAVNEAFFSGQAGSRYRPTAALSAGYAVDESSGRYPVDDFVSLGLSGNLPLAWFADRDLSRDYQRQIELGLRAAADVAAQQIRHELAEAWAGYHQARGALEVDLAQGDAARERLRVARARAAHDLPDDPTAPTAASIAALEGDGLLAQAAQCDHQREISACYIRIVEAQGLAAGSGLDALREAAAPAAAPAAEAPSGHQAGAPRAASVWAWHREGPLASMPAAICVARMRGAPASIAATSTSAPMPRCSRMNADRSLPSQRCPAPALLRRRPRRVGAAGELGNGWSAGPGRRWPPAVASPPSRSIAGQASQGIKPSSSNRMPSPAGPPAARGGPRSSSAISPCARRRARELPLALAAVGRLPLAFFASEQRGLPHPPGHARRWRDRDVLWRQPRGGAGHGQAGGSGMAQATRDRRRTGARSRARRDPGRHAPGRARQPAPRARGGRTGHRARDRLP